MSKTLQARYLNGGLRVEQNGNPIEINWKRVGEIAGGWYLYTQSFYLWTGYDHCLDPSRLLPRKM